MPTPIDPEMADIQNEWHARNAFTSKWMIVAEPEGYSVHEHTINGVAPSTTYPTREAAAARLLQLLGIKEPVVPQSWPEHVQIGRIVDAEAP